MGKQDSKQNDNAIRQQTNVKGTAIYHICGLFST